MGVLIRIGGDDQAKRAEWAKKSIEIGFEGLEGRLESIAGTYSVGDSITMADFFLVSIVGNANRWKVDMSAFPILTRINNTLSTLPEFKAADPLNQPDCPAELL